MSRWITPIINLQNAHGRTNRYDPGVDLRWENFDRETQLHVPDPERGDNKPTWTLLLDTCDTPLPTGMPLNGPEVTSMLRNKSFTVGTILKKLKHNAGFYKVVRKTTHNNVKFLTLEPCDTNDL